LIKTEYEWLIEPAKSAEIGQPGPSAAIDVFHRLRHGVFGARKLPKIGNIIVERFIP
jgi:hypothetical protein